MSIEVIVKKAVKIKGAPPSKRPGANNTPSRQRYWASHRLRDRKVRNLMRHCKLSFAAALALWERTRKRRKK